MIIVIGLNLVPVAFSMPSSNFLVAGVTLCIVLLITLKGMGFLKQLAILIAVFIGYTLASTLGLVAKVEGLLGIPVTDTIKITGLSFAAIVGVVLNRMLNRKTA